MDHRVTLELAAEIMARQLPILREAQERKGEVVGVATDYRDLDRLTGGLFDGDLIIVAARPGVGKSAFAGNIALNVAKPKRRSVADAEPEPPTGVAFFSLEMPREQIASRIACNVGKVEVNLVRQNTLHDDDWSALAGAVSELEGYPLWIDDTPAISLLELRARTRKLKREIENKRTKVAASRLGLVIVDYLQLMQGKRERGDSREREISSISQGLKNLAKELGIPIIALSQLNRAVEKKEKKDRRPQLSDLRESGAIEQDADMVIFLFRENYYDKSKPPLDCEAIIAKQRNGPTGTVHLKFDRKYLRFYAGERTEYDEEIDHGKFGGFAEGFEEDE
jgi:replicative DNA helicase